MQKMTDEEKKMWAVTPFISKRETGEVEILYSSNDLFYPNKAAAIKALKATIEVVEKL